MNDIDPATLDLIADSINGYKERLNQTEQFNLAFMVNTVDQPNLDAMLADAQQVGNTRAVTMVRVASFLKDMQI